MNKEYVITNEILSQEYGLDLNDYALEGTLIPAIIHRGLELAIDRACYLGEFHSESALNKYLSEDDNKRTSEDKVHAFIKVQYQIIYNLIFIANSDPRDSLVDNILVYQLGCKINGFQKGLFRKE